MRGTLSACLAFLASAGFCLGNQALMVDSNGVVVNPPRAAFMEENDVASKEWVDEHFQKAGAAEISFGFGLTGDGSSNNPVAVDPDVLPNGLDAVGFGMSGDGSETNPLGIDPSVVAVSTGRQDGASLVYDAAADRYGHAFVARAAIDEFDAVTRHGVGALGRIMVGQLLTMSMAPNGARHVYECTNAFDPDVDFAPGDTDWLPGGTEDSYWTIFVRQGATGLSGLAGADGLDGVGDMKFGPWQTGVAYEYSTSAPVVVRWAGRWYECVASSTNKQPDGVGATNYWAISVDKGDDGEIVVWTNFVDRGDWNSGDSYSTNDLVWFYGNSFVVSETNAVPGIGVAPLTDSDHVGVDGPHWHPRTLRGRRGDQGVPGDVVYSYTVYSLLPGTNTLFDNSPSATNRALEWRSTSGGQTTFRFVGELPLGTDSLSAVAGDLLLNGGSVVSGKLAAATMSDLPAIPWASMLPQGAALAFPSASLEGGTVSFSATSSTWRLSTGTAVATNWQCSGLSTNGGEAFLFQIERGTNEFAFPPGVTNSAPAVSSTNWCVLSRRAGSTNWSLE